jgi:hypothetical protein
MHRYVIYAAPERLDSNAEITHEGVSHPLVSSWWRIPACIIRHNRWAASSAAQRCATNQPSWRDMTPHGSMAQWLNGLNGSMDSINELHTPTRVRQAIIHPAPPSAVPIEIHLGDQKPAARVHFFNVGHMASATRALHAGLEDNRSARPWRGRYLVAARPCSSGPELSIPHTREILITPLVLRPPCALPKRPPIVATRAIHRERVISRHGCERIGGRPGPKWNGRILA